MNCLFVKSLFSWNCSSKEGRGGPCLVQKNISASRGLPTLAEKGFVFRNGNQALCFSQHSSMLDLWATGSFEGSYVFRSTLADQLVVVYSSWAKLRSISAWVDFKRQQKQIWSFSPNLCWSVNTNVDELWYQAAKMFMQVHCLFEITIVSSENASYMGHLMAGLFPRQR